MEHLRPPIKINGITDSELFTELEAEYELHYDLDRWSNCYFHQVNSDLLHVEGFCVACDWNRHINSVSEEDKRNWNFIEAWEWDDIWREKQNKLKGS